MRPLPALSLHRPLPGARARLFAFPHAGGGASAFGKLRAALCAYRVELCPLQAPGRENRSRERSHPTVEAVASEFAAAIETVPPLPFALLGHSFGGLTAYLAARFLSERGNPPAHLVVSGSLSPALPRDNSAPPPRTGFRQRIVALGGVPDEVLSDPDLFAMFEAVIRADMALADAYRHAPSSPLPCPITVYSGTLDKAAAPAFAPAWSPLSEHKLRRRNFDGNHFFLYADPVHVAASLVDDLGWRELL